MNTKQVDTDIDNAIHTLKKIRFFKEMESQNISIDQIIEHLIEYVMEKLNKTEEQAITYIYEHACSYHNHDEL